MGQVDPNRPSDDVALTELYERERSRVFGICFGMLHSAQDAEDAVQDTFTRIVARAGTLDGDPAAYVITTARNVCIDELRRRARRQTQPEPDPQPNATDRRVLGAEDAAMERAVLRATWRHIPEPDRPMFAYLFAGLSLGEIAAQLNVSAGAVGVRMFRARQRLRRLVPAPATVVTVLHPRYLLEAALRRLRTARADTTALLARLHFDALALGPVVLGVLAAVPNATAPATTATSANPAAQQAGARGLAGIVGWAHDLPASARSKVASTVSQASALPTFLDDFVASPHYQQDHALFAVGPAGDGSCTGCYSLFETRNGGASWDALDGNYSGMLLVPPFFPSSPTLYALETNGLARSDDGGRTFVAVKVLVDGAQSVPSSAEAALQRASVDVPVNVDVDHPPVGNPQHVHDDVSVNLAPAFHDAWNTAANTLAAITGNVAAIEPDSRPNATTIFLVNRQTSTISVYQSALGTLNPAFRVAPDQEAALDVFTGPGASGVFVVAETVSRGWSVYSCTVRGGCSWVGPAAPELRSTYLQRVSSPTFGTDHTFWYYVRGTVRTVTLEGTDAPLGIAPGWGVSVVLPDAQYATSHRVDVVAVNEQAPWERVLLESAGNQSFRQRGATPLDPSVDWQSLVRLPDGSLVGLRVAYQLGPDQDPFVCSTDDGLTWNSHC